MYIIIAILMFGVLIAIHEFGHFISAKACRVRVDEFAIGMGPAIFKKRRGETLYALRILPLGGFCAMGEDEESDDPRACVNQGFWKKFLILCAGSFMNFLLGVILIVIMYSPAQGFIDPVIAEFHEDCPYQGEDALQVGDRFYSIDGHRIYQYYDVSDFISKGDGSYDIVVIRDGKKVKLEDFELVPLEYEGYESKMYGFLFGVEEATIGAKIENTWNTCMEFVRMVWMGLSELVSGNVGVKDMAGPVGIVDMMAQTGEQAESVSDALFSIFYFGAFIAVNLAVMNMLPIPALDGGRVFLLIITCIIEAISRKKLDPKYEGYIHAAGMVLLLALMVYVMFNDIIRIVTG